MYNGVNSDTELPWYLLVRSLALRAVSSMNSSAAGDNRTLKSSTVMVSFRSTLYVYNKIILKNISRSGFYK